MTDPFLIDKVTAIAVHRGSVRWSSSTKRTRTRGRFVPHLRKSGIETLRVSALTGEGIDRLKDRIRGRGGGVRRQLRRGQVSVLNRLDSGFGAEVGAISDRIGRGRHTTRHVELHPVEGGGYIADTPGFSSFETGQMDLVLAEDLQYAFPEFVPYLGQCRFTGCAHVKEKGCAVRGGPGGGDRGEPA